MSTNNYGTDLELSTDQTSAIDALVSWWETPIKKQLITLGGYAGCGKTTIIALFRKILAQKYPSLRVAFCAFTGKASSVLGNKLKKIGKNEQDTVSTIHSLMYEPVFDGEEIIDWRKRNIIGDIHLIVIDEASMVSRQMYEDISSYGIPIIAVGDHGQLPPVDSTNFNLMSDPMIKLETLHRFSENNGLIKASMMARIDGYIKYGNYGDQVIRVNPKDSIIKKFFKEECKKFDDAICLCGFNKTRIDMNRKIRRSLGAIDDDLILGDKVVCLKNNAKAFGCPIFNGMIGEVTAKAVYSNAYDVSVTFPDDIAHPYKGVISKSSFCNEKPDMSEFIMYDNLRMLRKAKGVGDYFSVGKVITNKKEKIYLDNFDYGYAITTHKSQGSEWSNVVVLEEKSKYWKDGEMWRRWYYTAITRAKSKLLLIGNS